MEAKIADILADIYRLDPELKKKEKEILSVLDGYLQLKPDLEPDQEFVAQLRRKVLGSISLLPEKPKCSSRVGHLSAIRGRWGRKILIAIQAHLSYNDSRYTGIFPRSKSLINHMENQNGSASGAPQKSPFGQDGFGRQLMKFGVSLGGLLVFVIFVFAASLWQGKDGARIPGILDDGDGALSSKVLISAVGENAFGNLADLGAESSKSADNGSRSLMGAGEEAGGAGMSVQSDALAPVATGGATKAGVDGSMIMPYDPTYYVYAYQGQEFVQSEGKMDVLKRVNGGSGIAARKLTDALEFDLFDLGKLNNAKTSQLSFFEDREFGYRTDIDLNNGSVSIYKNYEKWPNLYADCRDEACYSRLSLKVSDIPGDEEMINAANAFLEDYRIDMSAYGSPQVDKGFMQYYDKSQSPYIPEEITVMYPLVVEGKTVYESYGDLNGLRVSYDIRNHRVTGMYSLMTHNYQSSGYEAETDTNRILEIATGKGYDVMPLRAEDGSGAQYKTVEIALDTPFLSYENMYRYENNSSAEYLVPCLVFPIKEGVDIPYYYRKRVIVPLIKDFIQNRNDYPIGIMKGGAAMEGGAGTSGSAIATDAVAAPAVP